MCTPFSSAGICLAVCIVSISDKELPLTSSAMYFKEQEMGIGLETLLSDGDFFSRFVQKVKLLDLYEENQIAPQDAKMNHVI